MYTRQNINFRLSEAAVTQIDKTAENYGLNRADVLRACVKIAFKNWGQVCTTLEHQSEGP